MTPAGFSKSYESNLFGTNFDILQILKTEFDKIPTTKFDPSIYTEKSKITFSQMESDTATITATPYDYQQKISGPIMDRFDIIVHMNSIKLSDLHTNDEESSASIRARVIQARDIQKARFPNKANRPKVNASLDGENLRRQLHLDEGLNTFLEDTAMKLDISARRYNRILRVARSIADLSGSEKIEKNDLLEAMSYRA